MAAKSRPAVAIGHVMMKTRDIKATTKFYLDLGMRKVWQGSGMSIVELRGGTHILFFKSPKMEKKAQAAKFDLMVDNVSSFHKKLKKQGKKVSALREHSQSGHKLFLVTDPDGRSITVYSSHTEGRSV